MKLFVRWLKNSDVAYQIIILKIKALHLRSEILMKLPHSISFSKNSINWIYNLMQNQSVLNYECWWNWSYFQCYELFWKCFFCQKVNFDTFLKSWLIFYFQFRLIIRQAKSILMNYMKNIFNFFNWILETEVLESIIKMCFSIIPTKMFKKWFSGKIEELKIFRITFWLDSYIFHYISCNRGPLSRHSGYTSNYRSREEI